MLAKILSSPWYSIHQVWPWNRIVREADPVQSIILPGLSAFESSIKRRDGALATGVRVTLD